LAVFRLEGQNTGIDRVEVPDFERTQYKQLSEPDGQIFVGVLNDLKVAGARAPNAPIGQIATTITVDGQTVRRWPGGSLGPNAAMSGAVWGVLERDKSPRLKLKTEQYAQTWQVK
jgi:hypothetical protein